MWGNLTYLVSVRGAGTLSILGSILDGAQKLSVKKITNISLKEYLERVLATINSDLRSSNYHLTEREGKTIYVGSRNGAEVIMSIRAYASMLLTLRLLSILAHVMPDIQLNKSSQLYERVSHVIRCFINFQQTPEFQTSGLQNFLKALLGSFLKGAIMKFDLKSYGLSQIPNIVVTTVKGIKFLTFKSLSKIDNVPGSNLGLYVSGAIIGLLNILSGSLKLGDLKLPTSLAIIDMEIILNASKELLGLEAQVLNDTICEIISTIDPVKFASKAKSGERKSKSSQQTYYGLSGNVIEGMIMNLFSPVTIILKDNREVTILYIQYVAGILIGHYKMYKVYVSYGQVVISTKFHGETWKGNDILSCSMNLFLLTTFGLNTRQIYTEVWNLMSLLYCSGFTLESNHKNDFYGILPFITEFNGWILQSMFFDGQAYLNYHNSERYEMDMESYHLQMEFRTLLQLHPIGNPYHVDHDIIKATMIGLLKNYEMREVYTNLNSLLNSFQIREIVVLHNEVTSDLTRPPLEMKGSNLGPDTQLSYVLNVLKQNKYCTDKAVILLYLKFGTQYPILVDQLSKVINNYQNQRIIKYVEMNNQGIVILRREVIKLLPHYGLKIIKYFHILEIKCIPRIIRTQKLFESQLLRENVSGIISRLLINGEMNFIIKNHLHDNILSVFILDLFTDSLAMQVQVIHDHIDMDTIGNILDSFVLTLKELRMNHKGRFIILGAAIWTHSEYQTRQDKLPVGGFITAQIGASRELDFAEIRNLTAIRFDILI